ncbi:alpha/beta-hydrolase [Didymella exigua CBS 183.55]|uniref:Carboxylic ester hydrolase n=1 Tax=Didymella exigua CBS 183.55 TaxID=1150837 RepID=A0A6A5RDW3_9PLEO|nr:alpha/beta-hydrolase [Didymella exigua CBS 183.55]KAF1926461.1 alpha/beta-hydrolase [Didymella exigua CBS 183.55]
MAALISALLCFVSLVSASTSSSPTLDSLTILTHNDLYGNSSQRQSSTIVVSKPQSYSASASSCAALGESLWSSEQCSQELDFLKYLGHDSQRHGHDLYWVASRTGAKCNAISPQGRSQQLPCDTPLPVLCSNTAPLSSPQSTSNSSKWQSSVSTGNATISGYRDSQSFRFLGIKYATIPSRFSDSTYLPPAGSNISAFSYGPQCIQGSCSSGEAPCSEDCLYLNIWTPTIPNGKSAKAKKKPVMVWIYGGGFVSGSASDTTFDGGAMASRGDVVLVTINYRLGNFGFLALEGTPLTGNYGLKDQNIALDWLHAHIDAFGGDKDKITIFGQSAGAASVRALLASPEARGKFVGAIPQSTPQGLNYASTFAKYLTITEATNRTRSLLDETGCTSNSSDSVVACLQAVPVANLTSGTVASYPVIDGKFLTSSGLPLGHTAPKLNVTLLSGNMHDDGSPFISYPISANLTAALLEQDFPVSSILNSTLFPLPAESNATLAIFNLTSRVETDGMFRCLGESTEVTAAKNGIFKNVYAYEFDRAFQLLSYSPNPPACEAPPTSEHPFGDASLPYYKCHSGELYYVFGTLVREGAHIRDENDIPFSQYVLDSWTAFARTGNPVPDTGFLEARGFTNTTRFVQAAGRWAPVSGQDGGKSLRVLDVVTRNEGWREVDQCEALGYGLGYYDV